MKGAFSEIIWSLPPGKKAYFASDFHFGIPNASDSLAREKRVVAWLERISVDAEAIFLQGDLFDAWIEYRQVVPRGFVRFLGKLGELTDAGIQIIAFPGNHDMWMTDYFERELNIKTYRRPVDLMVISSIHPTPTSFHIAHGDGLGPDDHLYKLLKIVFENWNFIKKYILDLKNGEWIWGIYRDYSPIEKDKAGFWKCPYHNSRACLELINRIKT